MIYGPVNDNGIWRTRYNNELYTLYDELDIVKVIKTGRFSWLGRLFGMHKKQEDSAGWDDFFECTNWILVDKS